MQGAGQHRADRTGQTIFDIPERVAASSLPAARSVLAEASGGSQAVRALMSGFSAGGEVESKMQDRFTSQGLKSEDSPAWDFGSSLMTNRRRSTESVSSLAATESAAVLIPTQRQVSIASNTNSSAAAASMIRSHTHTVPRSTRLVSTKGDERENHNTINTANISPWTALGAEEMDSMDHMGRADSGATHMGTHGRIVAAHAHDVALDGGVKLSHKTAPLTAAAASSLWRTHQDSGSGSGDASTGRVSKAAVSLLGSKVPLDTGFNSNDNVNSLPPSGYRSITVARIDASANKAYAARLTSSGGISLATNGPPRSTAALDSSQPQNLRMGSGGESTVPSGSRYRSLTAARLESKAQAAYNSSIALGARRHSRSLMDLADDDSP